MIPNLKPEMFRWKSAALVGRWFESREDAEQEALAKGMAQRTGDGKLRFLYGAEIEKADTSSNRR